MVYITIISHIYNVHRFHTFTVYAKICEAISKSWKKVDFRKKGFSLCRNSHSIKLTCLIMITLKNDIDNLQDILKKDKIHIIALKKTLHKICNFKLLSFLKSSKHVLNQKT